MKARHRRAVEQDFFFQSPAYALNDVAFDLVHEAIGVDDLPAVVGDVEPLNANLAGLAVDLDFGDRADLSGQQFILDVADTSSGGDIVLDILVPRGSWLPFRDGGKPSQ